MNTHVQSLRATRESVLTMGVHTSRIIVAVKRLSTEVMADAVRNPQVVRDSQGIRPV